MEPQGNADRPTADVVRMNTRSVHFPDLCVSCLASHPTQKIKVHSLTARSLFWVFVMKRSLVFSVPYCETCARAESGFRRILVLILFVSIGLSFWSAWSVGTRHLPRGVPFLLAWAVAFPLIWLSRHLRRIKPAITILSSPNDPYTDLRFARKEYRDAFLALNVQA